MDLVIKHYSAIIIGADTSSVYQLKRYIETLQIPINVSHITNSIRDAEKICKTEIPDILITEIILNDQKIFDFLNDFDFTHTQLIFTSQFSSYGVKVIEYDPIGFLTKPVDRNAFEKVIKKAVFNLQHLEILSQKINSESSSNQIAVSSVDKIDIIRLTDIIYIEADGRYSHFYLKSNKITASKNLGSYEKQLNESIFYRTHSKYIINLNAIKSIHRENKAYCIMNNKSIIPISRRRLDKLLFLFIK